MVSTATTDDTGDPTHDDATHRACALLVQELERRGLVSPTAVSRRPRYCLVSTQTIRLELPGPGCTEPLDEWTEAAADLVVRALYQFARARPTSR